MIAANLSPMVNSAEPRSHNNAALREIFGLKPTPEFEHWLERMGLWRNGKLTDRAGDATVFDREFR